MVIFFQPSSKVKYFVLLLSMNKKNIIYIGIASIFCLTTFYYFYKSPSDPTNIQKLNPIEQKYPSLTLSKGAFEQASRVPEDQTEETDQGESSEEDETDEEEIELDIESFFDGWTIQRNSLGGVASVISSGVDKNIPLPDAENQDGSVLLFAQEVAPLFGGKANQIGNSQVTETSAMKHYFYTQVIDDYEVYGGGLQVSVLQSHQSVFNVNSSIKTIDVENFNRNLTYNQAQAWERVRSEFSSSVTQINVEQHGRPQLFVRGSVQELAWVFDVRLSVGGQPDVRCVVVGAISGNILENLSTIVH